MKQNYIAIFLILFLSGCSSPNDDSQTTKKWYQYPATLHTATQEQWLAGVLEDQVASSGNFFSKVARGIQPELIDSIPEDKFEIVMLAHTLKMKDCITQTYSKGTINLKANEVAALCFTMMYP